jgi:hypothetical protein
LSGSLCQNNTNGYHRNFRQWATTILSNNPSSGIPDPFHNAFSSFLWELCARHCATTTCFSAIQKSVIELQGQSVVYTFLAVLREEMDWSYDFDQTRHWKNSFHFHFAVDDGPFDLSNMFNLVSMQASAKHFHGERPKSAIWTFGALPSHGLVNNSTFRWLRQEKINIFTKYVPQHSETF